MIEESHNKITEEEREGDVGIDVVIGVAVVEEIEGGEDCGPA